MMSCNLCPRACGVSRKPGETGVCGETRQLRIARAALHFWEEPCISGSKGSGTVFFSGCQMKCIFCQNSPIATGDIGKVIENERLSEIFFELKEKGANNINLVTPDHFLPQIVRAIERARAQGFDLPFVYNTGSYVTVDALKQLEGLISVYLPDFKYFDSRKSLAYAKAEQYPQVAKLAIAEMVRQVGEPKFYERDEETLIERGVIVRHLLLPGGLGDAKQIVRYLHETYGDRLYISLMNQYTPGEGVRNHPVLSKRVKKRDYDSLVDYAIALGVEQAYIQEGETAKDSFIPAFNYEGVEKQQ